MNVQHVVFGVHCVRVGDASESAVARQCAEAESNHINQTLIWTEMQAQSSICVTMMCHNNVVMISSISQRHAAGLPPNAIAISRQTPETTRRVCTDDT